MCWAHQSFAIRSVNRYSQEKDEGSSRKKGPVEGKTSSYGPHWDVGESVGGGELKSKHHCSISEGYQMTGGIGDGPSWKLYSIGCLESHYRTRRKGGK